MATITYSPGNGSFAPPTQTFDITSVVAERVGNMLNYYSFDTDGTMFVLHTQGVAQPDGSVKTMITGWDQFSGSTVLQSSTCMLDAQPFLDNMHSRNPSSARAMAYFLSGDDQLVGSKARDNMVAQGGNDALNGNGGNDMMNGGAGNDVLTGGTGADKLTGGAGADQFLFHAPQEGADTITDFTHGLDQLRLDAHAFGLAGPLSEGHGFTTGTAATSPGATLIYDAASGLLKYDSDGTGSAGAVTLAWLTNHAAMTASDILLV